MDCGFKQKGGLPPDYAELQVTTNFSFLQGASSPEELIERAAELKYRAIGITDHNTLAGIVRAHSAAKSAGIKYLVGCCLDLECDAALVPCNISAPFLISILVYPPNRAAYGRLCALLTLGKGRAPKGGCLLKLSDFLSCCRDFVCILAPPKLSWKDSQAVNTPFFEAAKIIRAGLPSKKLLFAALTKSYLNHKQDHSAFAAEIARNLGIPLVAVNNACYHIPERRPLQDVLTCIRNKCSIKQAGFALYQNAERYLKSPPEICRLFRENPSAVARTLEIAEMAGGFSLDELKYEYPAELCPEGQKPLEYLANLAWRGANERYPKGVPDKVKKLISEELKLIHELDYEKYFLTCHDIVKFARQKGILCQGRGAAANSAVCFCLGITSVDPDKIDLLFARFVSKERNEPPDIDIDFEHERREEVIQYIYQKYGRNRAGLTCEVITYRHRSAIRDVGKALGLSLETVDKLAKSLHRWTGCRIPAEDLEALGLNPADSSFQNTLRLADELRGFPRHLSQHVGGFIISEKPLCETVPILNAGMPDRTIIEWDKDDIEVLGMLKIDVLGLGMLTCIRKALDMINGRRGLQKDPPLELHTIPSEDPAVYDMVCSADTIGVFQIESRAQMSMLVRLKPRCFYDLVIEVAIVRPGPMQGNMVHPYLKRRAGLEKVHYPDKRVREILGKTMGVPIFQEQAMRLVIMLAKFTPGEAEKLRRAMAAWKKDKGAIASFQQRIVAGMKQNGYAAEFAESCVNQIKGFSEYGFPESHAASFALLVYASAWIKKYYPAEFCAALLNSQPMGFYAPSQIIRDAVGRGVKVLPLDVNQSGWETKTAAAPHPGAPGTVRLGLHLAKNLQKEQAEIIAAAVKKHGPFSSPFELWLKAAPNKRPLYKTTLEVLAKANAFRSMNLNQRQALWEIKALPQKPFPLDDAVKSTEKQARLPLLTPQQSMFQDYETTGFSLDAHPIAFVRPALNRRGVSTALALKNSRRYHKNKMVSAAGIGICRQRPGTAKGVVFITLEDETGIVNLIVRPAVFEQYQKIILTNSCLAARGILERTGDIVYINASQIEGLDAEVLKIKHEKMPVKSYSY